MNTTTQHQRLWALWALALPCACGGEVIVPTIETFTPRSGTAGTRITIQGLNLDRDGQGYQVSSGELPWAVYLLGGDRRYELAIEDATDNTLVVVVPEGAASGPLGLADGQGLITESVERFEVLPFPMIRVVNDAQYDVVDLRLNGEQMLLESRVIESGASVRVAVEPDRYRVEYAIGAVKEPWMRSALPSVESTTLGTETIVRIPPLEPIDLLTVGRMPTDWIATLRDPRGQPATVTLRVYGDGAWALFEGDTPASQGNLVAAPFAPYAHTTPFRLFEGGPVARLGPPFTRFDLENGPPHWRLLQYVRAP